MITKTDNDRLTPDDKTLVVMVGLPYSGKSTTARRFFRPFAAIVSPDAIRVALTGTRFFAPIEPLVWAIAKLMIRVLFLTGYDTVCIDICAGTRKRRAEWMSREWETKFFLVETSAGVCIQRAKDSGDEVIVPVIEKMAMEWEPLGEDESRWV